MSSKTRNSFFTLPNGPSPNGNSGVRFERDVLNGDVLTIEAGGGAINGLNRVESIYVDNTRGSGTLIILFPDTGRTIFVPPAAEGCYETFTQGSTFRIATLGAKKGVHARLMLFSCRKTVFERYPGGPVAENALDVVNPPGAYPKGTYSPPLVTYGWDASLISPVVTVQGMTVKFLNEGVMRWGNYQTVMSLVGPRYFEWTFSLDDNSAVGLGTKSDNSVSGRSSSRIFNAALVIDRFSNIYNGTVIQAQGTTGMGGNTIGFAIDPGKQLLDVTITTLDGIVHASTKRVDMSTFTDPIAPSVNVQQGGYPDQATLTTVGPFKSLPNGYFGWDE